MYFLLFIFLLSGCTNVDDASPDAHQDIEHSETANTLDEENVATTNPDKTNENTSQNSTENELNELNVHYIDAGQADATLFQYKDQDETYTILYDAGDWKRNEVVNYLEDVGVTAIDLIIISHPDADHIGQLAEIMTTFDVDEVWMSGNESSSKTFQNALEAILATDASYEEPRTGDQLKLGPMQLDVVHPEDISGQANEESVSVLFTYGETSFLFTGDAGKADEKQMMRLNDNLQADILHLGHHGSDTSSDPEFIHAVDPDIAIYSAGEDNSYGHPHSEVISFVQNEGITVYGTDIHGTIIATSNGNDLSIATKEDGTISPESTQAATSDQNNETADENAETSDADSDEFEDDCININEASIEELQDIIHIGDVRAEELIEQRPFQSVDDLTQINGIGPARIDDIKQEGIACTGG